MARSRRLAMMPSSVAPTRLSQLLASASFVVAGDSRMRVAPRKHLCAKASSSGRRSRSGSLDQRLAVGAGQEIEDDEERRRLRRELLHAALRRMDALQQGIERKRAVDRNDDFAVEDECRGLERCAPPRPAPGNSASAAGRISIAARPCRRRGRRGSGSRPISARTAIPPRSGSRRPTGLPSAGMADAMQEP